MSKPTDINTLFRQYVQPTMKQVKDELTEKQAKEMADYGRSTAGILSMMAQANMPGGDPYATIKLTGKWNSKTTEDYINMVKERLTKNKAFMAAIANNPKIDEQLDKAIIDHLVKLAMPKGAADYIIRKAAKTSIFNLANELRQTPLEIHIQERAEAAYNPSKAEKTTGWLLGTAADAVSMGGAGSWTKLGSWLAVDGAVTLGMNAYNSQSNSKDTKQTMQPTANKQTTATTPFYQSQSTIDRTQGRYKDVPLIVAPGQEEAYLQDVKRQEEKSRAAKATNIEPQAVSETSAVGHSTASQSATTHDQTSPLDGVGDSLENSDTTPLHTTTASNGWDNLLQATGFDGLGDTFKNLPYVISMLPDVLLGMFTGKNQSMGAANTWMPLASIFLGLFVKNPLLKVALIGMGGMNLLNKAGKESMAWQKQTAVSNSVANTNTNAQVPQYKQYADEQLNPRITNPVLQGNSLIANIDRVPYTIQLPQNVVDAYNAGALPLNTLANAVLAKHDANKQAAQQYGEVEQNTNTETIHRTR